MNDYGFKISLPGYPVETATPEQCAVHSSYPPFKAKVDQPSPHFATLNVDFTSGITQGVTQTLYQFEHGYTYVPFTIPFIVLTGDPLLGTNLIGCGFAGIGATLAVEGYADSTNFYVTIYDNNNWIDASSNLQVSYYVFCENGA